MIAKSNLFHSQQCDNNYYKIFPTWLDIIKHIIIRETMGQIMLSIKTKVKGTKGFEDLFVLQSVFATWWLQLISLQTEGGCYCFFYALTLYGAASSLRFVQTILLHNLTVCFCLTLCTFLIVQHHY